MGPNLGPSNCCGILGLRVRVCFQEDQYVRRESGQDMTNVVLVGRREEPKPGWRRVGGHLPGTPSADQPVAAIRLRISDSLADSISETSTP